MEKKKQVRKKQRGSLKKRVKLNEVPQPTKLLLAMAFAIIMLSGYLLISNVVLSFALNENEVIDYSSPEMGILKQTLHGMNANLIQLNQATSSSFLTSSELEELKEDFNESVESINQLSYLTEQGKKKVSQEQLYEIYKENRKLQMIPLLHIYAKLEKMDPSYQVTKDAFTRNVLNLMLSNGSISREFYNNFRYTSFDDSNILGSISLDQKGQIPSQTMQLTTNYVQLTDALLKMVLVKGGLVYA